MQDFGPARHRKDLVWLMIGIVFGLGGTIQFLDDSPGALILMLLFMIVIGSMGGIIWVLWKRASMKGRGHQFEHRLAILIALVLAFFFIARELTAKDSTLSDLMDLGFYLTMSGVCVIRYFTSSQSPTKDSKV